MSDHECDDAVEQLYTYLDGELDAETLRMVEAHLAHCSPCLEAFDFEAELRKVIVARCAEEVPAGTRDRLLGMLGTIVRNEGGCPTDSTPNGGASGGL